MGMLYLQPTLYFLSFCIAALYTHLSARCEQSNGACLQLSCLPKPFFPVHLKYLPPPVLVRCKIFFGLLKGLLVVSQKRSFYYNSVSPSLAILLSFIIASSPSRALSLFIAPFRALIRISSIRAPIVVSPAYFFQPFSSLHCLHLLNQSTSRILAVSSYHCTRAFVLSQLFLYPAY